MSEQRMWGGRARLGLIVPTTNTTNEAEWAALRMDGVSVHTARMALHAVSSDDGEALPEVLRAAIGQLTPARPSAIAYACTAGSMVIPVESMPAAMTAEANLPCTSTAAATVAALRALGAQRVAVATPYHEALNTQWAAFLQDCGFVVSAIRGLGIGAGGPQEFTRIALLEPRHVAEHATATFASGPADALLLSCTDMPTLKLIPDLEQRLGVPVVSSNTATFWRALALSGVTPDIAGAGLLLQGGRGA